MSSHPDPSEDIDAYYAYMCAQPDIKKKSKIHCDSVAVRSDLDSERKKKIRECIPLVRANAVPDDKIFCKILKADKDTTKEACMDPDASKSEFCVDLMSGDYDEKYERQVLEPMLAPRKQIMVKGEKDGDDMRCPPPPIPSDEQAISNLGEYMKAAGIKACNTTKRETGGSADVSAYTLGGAYKGHVDFHDNSYSSEGCENVVASSLSYTSAKQDMNCVINKASTSASNDLKVSQDILFESVDGGMTIPDKNCKGGSRVSQTSKVRMASTASMDDKTVTTLAKQTSIVMDERIQNNQISGATTTKGSQDNGTKIINDTKKSVKDVLSNINMKKNISNAANKYAQDQKIKVSARGKNSIMIVPCIVEQDFATEMQAAAVMNTVMDSNLQAKSDEIFQKDQQNTTKPNPNPEGGGGWSITAYLAMGTFLLGALGTIVHLFRSGSSSSSSDGPDKGIGPDDEDDGPLKPALREKSTGPAAENVQAPSGGSNNPNVPKTATPSVPEFFSQTCSRHNKPKHGPQRKNGQ